MAIASRRLPPQGTNAPRRATTASAPAKSSYSGAEGLRKAQEVEARDAARREAQQMNQGQPFRFYCPPGESRDIIVVDDKPDFFRFEHCMKNPRTNRWDIYCACINENANCPGCKVLDRPSYYAMFLTIIDITPYTNKDGVEVPWSKKLLTVKTAQQKKITRYYERHGTLRGMVLRMTRDSEKDANIGNDIEFLEFAPEEELEQYVDQYTDKKEKVHDVIGHEPFDYWSLMPDPTEQQIRAIVGGRPEPGSRDEEEEAGTARAGVRRASFPGNDGWQGRGTSGAAPARTRPARQVEEEPQEEEPQEEPQARPVARRAAPTSNVARRGPPAEEVEQEEEAPPVQRRAAPQQRTASPARAAQPAARPPVGRRPPVNDPEPQEEDAPQRAPASSLAARRAALRRG